MRLHHQTNHGCKGLVFPVAASLIPHPRRWPWWVCQWSHRPLDWPRGLTWTPLNTLIIPSPYLGSWYLWSWLPMFLPSLYWSHNGLVTSPHCGRAGAGPQGETAQFRIIREKSRDMFVFLSLHAVLMAVWLCLNCMHCLKDANLNPFTSVECSMYPAYYMGVCLCTEESV